MGVQQQREGSNAISCRPGAVWTLEADSHDLSLEAPLRGGDPHARGLKLNGSKPGGQGSFPTVND